MKKPDGPVVLCILDGFGERQEHDNNAISLAKTPNYDRLRAEEPFGTLATSGSSVGLPEGQMGNSEVGHTNIGAGRVVLQDLPRINEAIENGTLGQNPVLTEFISNLKAAGGACHLMGLVSPGGVHSHQDHMVALAKILHQAGIKVWVHAFLDGRDTPPKSAHEFLLKFITDCGDAATLATVTGRYYAMDRDKNWSRTEQVYSAIVNAEGTKVDDFCAAIQNAYLDATTDEFFPAHVSKTYPRMSDGDALLMANFRADRARQILTAILDKDFDAFNQDRKPKLSTAAGMVEYSSALNAHLTALFPLEELHNTLGEWVSKSEKKQLRLSETEKYAHVTFFLNGGRETVFEGEERILVPSPKVATYDLKPEMSAYEVTDRLVAAIQSGDFDLIIVNYANPDMVGHTGILSAAITAIETIDICLGRVENALSAANGIMLVTADHGNVEMMHDPETDGPHTAHTSLEVPIFLVNSSVLGEKVLISKNGCLADIAPTLLNIMALEIPTEMTGTPLVKTDPSTGEGTRVSA